MGATMKPSDALYFVCPNPKCRSATGAYYETNGKRLSKACNEYNGGCGWQEKVHGYPIDRGAWPTPPGQVEAQARDCASDEGSPAAPQGAAPSALCEQMSLLGGAGEAVA